VKRTIATVVAGAVVFAGAASAATPTQRIAALEKSVKTLKKTVAKQNKSLKTIANALEANFIADACIVGVTADAIQSTWGNFESVFGPQQTISDRNACSLLRNPTVSRQGIQTQPTPEVFGQLITWLIPSARHVLR
jgi:hypothetical protein